MKRTFIFTVSLVFCLSIFAKDIKELVVTTTPPMSCQNCENTIKGNLRFEKGVKKIETNLSDQRVTVEYDADKTTPEKIEEAFGKIGYKVEVINTTGNTGNAPQSQDNAPEPANGCNGCGGCCGGKAE